MNENYTNLNQTTVGFGLAAAVAIVFNTLLTYAKESYPSLLALMKGATSHHWISHGLLVVIVFFVLGFLFSKMNFAQNFNGKTLSTIIFISSAIGGLGLFIWFYFI